MTTLRCLTILLIAALLTACGKSEEKKPWPGGGELTGMSRSLFSESAYAGMGYGLGFGVVVDAPRTLLPSSRGEYFWGGLASTSFWIDPVEELIAVFMTQLIPSSATPIRRELRTLVYAALTDRRG